MGKLVKIAGWGLVAALALAGVGASYVAWRISDAVVVAPDFTKRKREARDPLGEHGLTFETVEFEADDGVKLRGWLVPAVDARAGAVLAHGRGGSRLGFLDLLPDLHAAGYCVLMYDSRGHGESGSAGPGDGFRGGYRDVIAAVSLVKRRCGVGKVAAIGSSQGASSSLIAASESTAVDAVVAVGTGPSLYDLLRASKGLAGMPDWVVAYATRITLWRFGTPLERVLDVSTGPITLVEKIAPRPLFLINGTEDEVIPITQAGRLYARAAGAKAFWVVKGGPHAGLRKYVGPEFGRRVLHFLETRMLRGEVAPLERNAAE